MISREEIKEENKLTMICYLMTFNYSERKLKEKSYQELSAIYLNHNPPKGLLNKPTLDSELNPFEKVKKNGIHFKFPIKDSDVEEALVRLYDVLTDDYIGNKIDSLLKDYNTIKQALSDNQSKLNAIEEVVNNANKYLNAKRVVIVTNKIKQILKGDE